ncbi:MAG: alanine racemase [Pseudomonadota bacterium]
MVETTLTINLDALAANYADLNAVSSPTTETAAVVKANAYGTGIERAGPKLKSAGAKTFFTATTQEAASLAKVIGPDPRIFVFGGLLYQDFDLFKAQNFIPLLNSVDHVKAYLAHPNQTGFGLQIDTGMNRLGLEAPDLREALNLIGDAKPELVISHLACADTPEHDMNAAQLHEFKRLTDGMNWRRSLAATGGTLLGASYHFDLTRPGIGLYGGAPFTNAQPVVHLDIPVIQTRQISAGENVGYGAAWTAQRDSRIATISAGYADGLVRAMGQGKVNLYAGSTPCPLIGRVSMDLLTVDVTDIENIPDTLSLLNLVQGVDDLAAAAGTIGYEFLTSLGGRYSRRYVGKE